MKTLTKLTLTTAAMLVLGATTVFGGPGPVGSVNRARARELPAATAMAKCDRMTVNRAPKLGGAAVVTCTKAVKGTLACRLACG